MGAEKMSSVALKLYQGLTDVGEDKQKAKLFADAFEELESRYPEVKDLVTGGQLTEKALLIQKEIQENKADLQKEIQENKADLQKEIQEYKADLQKEIQESKADLQREIQENKVALQETKAELIEKIGRQTWLYFGGLTVFATVLTISTALVVKFIK